MVAPLIRGLVGPILEPVIRPVLQPITRLLAGLIAIPLFRIFRRKVVRVQELDEELEKDIDQWFRGSILLLMAAQNMEKYLFPWAVHVTWVVDKRGIETDALQFDNWFMLALRLMLAISVIEKMPDQTLFDLIHPGMRRIKFQKGVGVFRNLWRLKKDIALGVVCQHLNRSSPVFAILSTLLQGPLGWVFYVLAISQYLIIGLVTSQDRAADVLSEFDLRVAEARRDLIDDLRLPPPVAEYEKARGPCPDNPPPEAPCEPEPSAADPSFNESHS